MDQNADDSDMSKESKTIPIGDESALRIYDLLLSFPSDFTDECRADDLPQERGAALPSQNPGPEFQLAPKSNPL